MNLFKFVENKKICLFLIFLISIIIKALYFYHYKDNPFFNFIHDTSDAINFDIGAQNFASGDLLASSANNSYSPLYKYFLGFIYIVAGRNLPVVWGIQLLMGTIIVLLVFLITSKLFNNRAALISAFLYALYGPELMYEGILLRASFITLLGVLSLYLLIQLKENVNFWRIAITGIFISLFIQSRPNVILVFALLPLISLDYNYKKNINTIISLSFIVLLSFIPLLMQTYMVHGKFVFFDASGPKAILMGNNPAFEGTGYSPQISNSIDSSLKYDEIFLTLLRNLISHPIGMITLYIRKFYYFFNSYEFPSNYNFYIFQEYSFLLKTPLSKFSVFSSLGLMGFLINIKNFKKLRLLNAFMIGMTLSVVLLYVVSRFRIPVVPYYAIFAGCFLDRICTWNVLRKYREIVLSVTVIIILQLLLNSFPNLTKTNESNEYGNLGNAYLNLSNVEKAIAAYGRSLEIDPDNFYSRNNLGKIYADQGQLSKAVSEFRKAIKINPNHWEPHYNIGLAYIRAGQFSSGEKALLSALNIAPQSAPTFLSLGNLYEDTGQFKLAINYFKKYISLSKKDWKGYFLIGNVLSKTGHFELAIKEYKKSKKLNPKHSQTLVNLGNAYSTINKPVLALKEYLTALSLNLQNPIIHRNIGILYSKETLYDPLKAIYHLRKSLELDPNEASIDSVKKLINQLKQS
jgi:tetratricopeptide (TPR) repeat protein